MAITFPTIDDLVTYINQVIVENNINDITATEHNNVENGLVQFIKSAPLNYGKARVITSAGLYSAANNEAVLVFTPAATGSLELTDNKWYQWIIINQTGSNKQLTGAISSYRNTSGQSANYVAPNSELKLYKGKDNLWYGVSSISVAPVVSGYVPAFMQIKVGVTQDQQGNVIMSDTDTGLVITVQNPQTDSVWITVGGIELPRGETDIASYGTPVYTTSTITINFNTTFNNNDIIVIHYGFAS